MSKHIDQEELRQQHARIDNAFATIRATLQKTPSSQGWYTILARVIDCVKPQPWSYDEPIERFKSELVPYIESSLLQWPDDLRVIRFNELAHGCDLGRVVLINKAYDQQTKKGIASDIKHLALVAPSLNGIRLETISKYLLEHVQGHCKALSKPLNFIHISASAISKGATPKRGEVDQEIIRETVEWLIAQHGSSIVGLGLDLESMWSASACVDALWEPVINHAYELGELRHLGIGKAYAGDRDWGVVLLEHPAFDRLNTLSEVNYSYRIPVKTLMKREASKNIRRLRLYNRSDATYRALIQSENLCNLEVAELLSKDYPEIDDGWGTEVAEHWEYERRKLQGDISQEAHHPFLNKSELKLEDTSLKELYEIFLDSENAHLVPSERVERLAITDLDDLLLRVLFSEGHTAYPNLRELELRYPINLGPADYATIQECGVALLDQLDLFELYPQLTRGFLGAPQAKEGFERLAKPWFDIAMDTSFHPVLRHWAWQTFRTTGPRNITSLKTRLKMLDVPYTSSMKRDELVALLDEAIPPEIKQE